MGVAQCWVIKRRRSVNERPLLPEKVPKSGASTLLITEFGLLWPVMLFVETRTAHSRLRKMNCFSNPTFRFTKLGKRYEFGALASCCSSFTAVNGKPVW